MSRREYDQYLSSDAWKHKRGTVLKRDRHRCAGCGSTAELHVHHCTYERFGHEPLRDLITLCESCHKAVHRLHRERGGDLAMATAEALAALRGATLVPVRMKKVRKRKAKPMKAEQLKDARVIADAMLVSGMKPGAVRKQVIPEFKRRLREQAR